MTTNEAIQELTRRIVETAQPCRVILFGSSGRGSADEANDLDFLVLVDDGVDASELAGRLYQVKGGVAVPCDFVVATQAEYEDGQTIAGSVYREAARDGRVVYERAA